MGFAVTQRMWHQEVAVWMATSALKFLSFQSTLMLVFDIINGYYLSVCFWVKFALIAAATVAYGWEFVEVGQQAWLSQRYFLVPLWARQEYMVFARAWCS